MWWMFCNSTGFSVNVALSAPYQHRLGAICQKSAGCEQHPPLIDSMENEVGERVNNGGCRSPATSTIRRLSMNISFNNRNFDFRPWTSLMGRVFTTEFAFDCETTLIDEALPWIAPAYVLGGAFDGTSGFFVRRSDVAAFFFCS
jgi:hypothetical protein